VTSDTITLPNVRNFLYEAIVILYEMGMYIYIYMHVCVCVFVCSLYAYFHCAVKRTDNIKGLNETAKCNNGI
jgi:hypothetical protein